MCIQRLFESPQLVLFLLVVEQAEHGFSGNKSRNSSREIHHGHRRPPPSDMDRRPSHSATTLRKESNRTRQTGWGHPGNTSELMKSEEPIPPASDNPQTTSDQDLSAADKPVSSESKPEKDDSQLKTLNEYFQSKNLNRQAVVLPARAVDDDDEKWGSVVDVIRRKEPYPTNQPRSNLESNKKRTATTTTTTPKTTTLEINPNFGRRDRRDREGSSKTSSHPITHRKMDQVSRDKHPRFKSDDFPVLS